MSIAKLVALIKAVAGSGGGGGSGGMFVANVVYGESDAHLDKTAGEIVAAFDAGKTIYVKDDASYDNPEEGYTAYKYMALKLYQYHSNTGTSLSPTTYWEFKFDVYTFTAYASTDYPVMNE